MNSTSQTLTITPSHACVVDDSSGCVKASRAVAAKDDKSPENKDFLNVLHEQQSEQTTATKASAGASDKAIDDESKALASVLPVREDVAGEFVEGKDLPAGGIILPGGQQSPVTLAGQTTPLSGETAAGTQTTSREQTAKTTLISNSNTGLTAGKQTKAESAGLSASKEHPLTGAQQPATGQNTHQPIKSQQLLETAVAVHKTPHAAIPVDKKEPIEIRSASALPGTAQTSQPGGSITGPGSGATVTLPGPDSSMSLKPGQTTSTLLENGFNQTAEEKASDTAPPATVSTTVSKAYRQPTTMAPVQPAVPIEVGKPGWSDAVMGKVMWMSAHQINTADIALDPPELGPLQVRITTSQEQTSVAFSSNHGVVRDALDQGLPRLREMLQEQGLNLADVDVSKQGANQRGDTDEAKQESVADADNNNAETARLTPEHDVTQTAMARPLGLVDQYV